jgi:hypothetical protein
MGSGRGVSLSLALLRSAREPHRWAGMADGERWRPRHSSVDEKDGVDDGVRTRDHWSHSPVLYQLSYIHRHQAETRRHRSVAAPEHPPAPETRAARLEHPALPAARGEQKLARLEGIEPPTDGLEIRCSIHLSYRRGVYPALPGTCRRSSSRGERI